MQNPAQSNNFKISSQLYIQQLDSTIIQLTKALAIEHSIKPDPDAKEMVRKILLARAHSLMSEESEAFAQNFVDSVAKSLVNHGTTEGVSTSVINEFLKLIGLDNG